MNDTYSSVDIDNSLNVKGGPFLGEKNFQPNFLLSAPQDFDLLKFRASKGFLTVLRRSIIHSDAPDIRADNPAFFDIRYPAWYRILKITGLMSGPISGQIEKIYRTGTVHINS
jgi:hypothetical protein